MIKDAGDKLTDADRQPVEEAIAALKQANEGTDVAAITAALDALNTAQHKAAESLYKQSEPPPPTDGGAPGDESPADAAEEAGGDVIDAEVVEEDKK